MSSWSVVDRDLAALELWTVMALGVAWTNRTRVGILHAGGSSKLECSFAGFGRRILSSMRECSHTEQLGLLGSHSCVLWTIDMV